MRLCLKHWIKEAIPNGKESRRIYQIADSCWQGYTCSSSWTSLGQHGVNIVEFTKQFNARTADQGDLIIPVVITVYADRSFSFVTKTPPAPVLIKKACNIKSGSATPNKTKVATLSKAKLQEIAELKMPDLNAASLEAAMSMIAGTARSMGVTVEE